MDWTRLAAVGLKSACHPRAPTVAYSQGHLRSTPSAILNFSRALWRPSGQYGPSLHRVINETAFQKKIHPPSPPGPSSPVWVPMYWRGTLSTCHVHSGRAGAFGAAAAFLSMRVCRRSVASHARLLARSGLRPWPQHLWRRGLRPHRRLRRHSARPSDALRCCRIRLHWRAKTPRPRAIPPNGRALRMKL